ncbi:MAG: hypothetical protein QOJ91_687 [Sphingomonadales bacterium]|jgi:hypothetical protein|nr:hypothetical protein [Sphingomonadales bacterium]
MIPPTLAIAELVFCAASVGLNVPGAGSVDGQPPSASGSAAGEAPATHEKPQASQSDASLPASPPAAPGKEIVVTGARERGSVVGRIPPERTLTPFEIDTYGATDVGTLIQNLGPLATSIRGSADGPPIVLLNGQRIASSADIARIPTEAIQRMEVFPEALALAYGFRPDQKVINIVTFQRFSKRNVEIDSVVPTEGGRADNQFSTSLLRIRNDTRLNFDASYRKTGALLESERDLVALEPTLGLGEFRTILPESERIVLNGTLSRPLSRNFSATLNARFVTETDVFLLGLQSDEPLSREIESNTFHVGAALNGRRDKWIWSLTANVDRTDTRITTKIDGTPSPDDQTDSSNTFAEAVFVLGGPLADLPAGPATVSLRAELGMLDFVGTSTLSGTEQQTKLARNRIAAQGSLDVPITSSSTGPSWLGIVSANVNVAIEDLSDIGFLKTYGIGLNWSPIPALKLYGSLNNEEREPSVEQLGAPQLSTPNIRIFDSPRGETVDITRIYGGNPLLRSENRSEFSLGVYIQPFSKTDLTLSSNYVDTKIDFPIADTFENSEIEFIFPERVVRDAQGKLLRIDARPLNFSSARQRNLRSGISFSKQLTKGPPLPSGSFYRKVQVFPNEAAMRAGLPPGTVVVEAAPGSVDAQRIESLSSRFTLALYHTWRLTDEITPQAGGPTFDLLDGFATDVRGLSPRHELSFQAGAFQSWFGARLTADWRSKARTRSLSSTPISTDRRLTLSNYTTVDFSVFANPAERLGGKNAPGWIKGTRVTLSITNLLNTRPRVVDENGVTPIIYQPVYLNPLGRTFSLSLRKVF